MRVHVDSPSGARATTAATRSRPSCSTSTTSGTRTSCNDGAVPPEQEEQARLAVANCPELAIEISEDA